MRIQIVATALAAVLACAATATQAQTAPAPASAPATAAPTPPAVAPAPAPTPQARITSGTLIVVEITQLISTKIQKRGDMFTLKLAEPIKYGDREIVAAGTPGMGQVIDSQPPGFGGAPAKLVLAARYLEINGQHVPIHAMQLGGSGQDRDGLAMAMSMMPYVGIASILVQGGQMEVSSGSHAFARLGADVPIPEAPPPNPVAPAAAPAPAPAAAAPATAPQGTPQ